MLTSLNSKWQQWKLALLDLDGTLYRGEDVIPGAAQFVERLRERGIRPAFVTNNSTRTPGQVVDKLSGFGIKSASEEIFTSSQLTAATIRRRVSQHSVVAMMGDEGLRQALLDEGLFPLQRGDEPGLDKRNKRTRGGDDTHSDSQISTGQVDAIAVGLDLHLTYDDLAWMSRQIVRKGRWFLTNDDVRLPHGSEFLPGTGAIGRLLEVTTGIAPQVVGKPNPAFVDFVLTRYQASVAEAVMVGDNMATDIFVANRARIDSIFVQTGVPYHPDEYPQLAGEVIEATFTVESVADLLMDE